MAASNEDGCMRGSLSLSQRLMGGNEFEFDCEDKDPREEEEPAEAAAELDPPRRSLACAGRPFSRSLSDRQKSKSPPRKAPKPPRNCHRGAALAAAAAADDEEDEDDEEEEDPRDFEAASFPPAPAAALRSALPMFSSALPRASPPSERLSVCTGACCAPDELMESPETPPCQEHPYRSRSLALRRRRRSSSSPSPDRYLASCA